MNEKKGGVHFEGGKAEIDGPVVGGDVGELVMGNKIVLGDAARSNLAIGSGAQAIVNHIHQAASKVDELEKSIRVAERLLAAAVEKKVTYLVSLAGANEREQLANPYKALLDYKLEDAPFFYGRTRAIEIMLGKMRHNPLTVLHSDSGSGKSSLIQAGLASRLVTQGHLPLYCRPYRQQPGVYIKRAFLPDYATQPELVRFGDDQMSLRGFLERVTAYLGDGRLHIFLDQFEEFFTELTDDERRHFATELQDCIQSDLPVRWILSLRKDFFSDLRIFNDLRPFENEYFLPTLRIEEAREVIVEPGQQKEVRYENGLVGAIIDDIRLEKEGVPPAQVQLVCFTLFEELQGEMQRDVITRELYDRPRGQGAGGARGILTSHLSRVLSREFSPEKRPLARQVLVALISSDKRRVVKSRSLLEQEIALSQLEYLDHVLDTLQQARLLRVEENEDNEHFYELTHDYLLAEIEFDPETQARKVAQELLNQEVMLYQSLGTLLSQDRYEIINSQREYLRIDDVAATLLRLSEESFEAQRRQEEEDRRALSAEKERAAAAEKRRKQVLFSRLAAEAKNMLGREPERALLLATAAVSGSYREDPGTGSEAWETMLQIMRAPYRGSLYGHTDRVTGAAFSPDGRRLVSTSVDRTARLWDLDQGVCLAVLEGHEYDVTSAVYAPDGARFLTYSRDGTARMWAAQDGHFLFALEGHDGWINTAEFNPDGQYILTASQDGSTRLWDAGTGSELKIFPGNTAVYSATFDSSGEQFLTAEWDHHYRLWDIGGDEPLAEIGGHTARHIRPVFTSEGRYFITGETASSVRFRDRFNYAPLFELTGHDAPLISFQYDAQTQHLLTASADGITLLWNLEGITFDKMPLQGAALDNNALDRVRSLSLVDFSPLGTYLLLATEAGELQLRYGHNGELLLRIGAHEGPVTCLAVAGDGRRFISAGSDHKINIWAAYDALLQGGCIGHRDQVLDASFSPDGRYIVSASRNKELRFWDSEMGIQRAKYTDHAGPVRRVLFSGDGRRMLSTADEDHARLRDGQTGRTMAHLEEKGHEVNVAAFSADGGFVATAAEDGTAVLWDSETGEKMANLGRREPQQEHEDHGRLIIPMTAVKRGEIIPTSVAFSPDGRRLLTTSYDLTAFLWDLPSRSLIAVLQGHEAFIRTVAFSPDGTCLATGAGDAAVRLWDANSGILIAELEGHVGAVNVVIFDSSGRRLLSAAADGTARMWDAQSGASLGVLPGHGDSGLAADVGPVSDAAFSPDGAYLLTAQGTVAWLRDGENCRVVAEFAGHQERIRRVKFSADGRRFLTASSDGTVRIWPMPPANVQGLLREAKTRLRRAFTDKECRQYFADDPQDCPRTLETLFGT